MGFTKLELSKLVRYYALNVDENKFLESEDKFYWVVNKKFLLHADIDKMAKRSKKEFLHSLIEMLLKYQKGGTHVNQK